MVHNSAPVASEQTALPALVVDLDGTLSRTDTLYEALLQLLATRPARSPAPVDVEASLH